MKTRRQHDDLCVFECGPCEDAEDLQEDPTCMPPVNVSLVGGGYNNVYKSLCPGRKIALKTLRIHGTEESLAKANHRYSVEINTWSQLQHRNVLPAFYLVNPTPTTSGTLLLQTVSPWVKNGNVLDYLTEFPDTNRRNLVTEAAAGLMYLHKSGVVHGDLKSVNVLIDEMGHPMLSDFGLAAVLEPNREPLSITSTLQRLRFDEDEGLDNVYPTSLVTSSRPVCRYMAPELLNNERSYSTTASDVYMFACLCYESFVETQPFADLVSVVDVLLAIHRGGQPSRPPVEHPAGLRGLDNFMWKLLESCWTSNPVDRPSIQQVHECLQAANHQDYQLGNAGHNSNREHDVQAKQFDGLKLLAHL